jgi:UDP-3-O-[3-hydroxymyristoyl] N-acetylglucosamine deacetylase
MTSIVPEPIFHAAMASRCQRTLRRPATVSGFGLWSGRDVRVEFRPAPLGAGIAFVRDDLPGVPRIPALVEYRTETPLRTTLKCGEAGVDMVEHILAVLYGLGVDHCEIGVSAQEMPGGDGSAAPFADAAREAGFVDLACRVDPCVVQRRFRVECGDTWIEATPSPSGHLELDYTLDYEENAAIGRQHRRLSVRPETFQEELAPARTFALKSEADFLRSQGLALRTTYRDLLVFDDAGPIENTLRYPDECVRHKLLDLVGDLALIGRPLVGRIRAYRSGHRLNGELVRALAAATAEEAVRKCA